MREYIFSPKGYISRFRVFLNLHPVAIHLNHSQYSRPYWEQKSICIKPEMFIRWNFFKLRFVSCDRPKQNCTVERKRYMGLKSFTCKSGKCGMRLYAHHPLLQPGFYPALLFLLYVMVNFKKSVRLNGMLL